MPTVTANFETRREAELAVEHLVQEHGVDRDDVTVGPAGEENSAGTEAGGSDLDDGFDDDAGDGPELAGAIAVSVVAEDDDQAEAVQEILEEFGGGDVVTDQ